MSGQYRNLSLAALAALATGANAVNLIPGGSVVTNGGIPPTVSLVATQTVNITGADFFGNTSFTSEVVDQVIRNTDNTLSFVFAAHNDAASADSIFAIAASGFKGYTTDVNWALFTNPVGPIQPPFVGSTTADRSGNGRNVTFQFANNGNGLLLQGDSTYALYIKTNAYNYDMKGTISLLAGGVGQMRAYEPVGPVPEPASMATLGIGAMGLWRLRRKK